MEGHQSMTSILTSAFDTWSFVLWFSILSLVMMFGNIIRRKVMLFRNLLFPTAIIAGFLGLGVKYLWYYLPELVSFVSSTYSSDFLVTAKSNVIDFNNFLQVITYRSHSRTNLQWD